MWGVICLRFFSINIGFLSWILCWWVMNNLNFDIFCSACLLSHQYWIFRRFFDLIYHILPQVLKKVLWLMMAFMSYRESVEMSTNRIMLLWSYDLFYTIDQLYLTISTLLHHWREFSRESKCLYSYFYVTSEIRNKGFLILR